ncbi:hypothetical protein NDK43_23435 [Neobacillus pocheonensis]|uniref:Uncharacterized protein n=1 Tax=Neobacillus pocheonensis TaxID=363869 RepID=A0ABT0WFC8_9BACI|nr:hypothetical protein [Neobacillus pocheonensis]
MKTCPYCGSHIERMDHQYYYCDFCCMNIDIRIIKENHERLEVRFRDFVLTAYIGVPSGKCGFTTLRKSKYKKPNFSMF